MMYEFCAQTDSGLTRENNEDSVALDESCGLAILADGMGGYNAGEVASSMATASILAELGQWLRNAEPEVSGRAIRHAMKLAVRNSNTAVFDASRAVPGYAGMGTTLVVAVFLGMKLVVGHIGDSRCYRLRGNTLSRCTRDHSLLQEQLDAGLITPRQAEMSIHRNLVTRALGVEYATALEVNEYKVQPGDLYLMCSDGLSDMVGDDMIATVLKAQQPLPEMAVALIDSANAGGGRDNISVMLARAAGGVDKRGLMSRLLGA